MVDEASINIHYIKAQNFREIACDGVVGGPTPHGKIWIAFFTERFPLPRITRHAVHRDESNGYLVDMPGDKVEGRDGVIRNVEFGVYLTTDEAKTLASWLTENLQDSGASSSNE